MATDCDIEIIGGMVHLRYNSVTFHTFEKTVVSIRTPKHVSMHPDLLTIPQKQAPRPCEHPPEASTPTKY